MPSRQVNSLVVAAAFALFAILLFCARDEDGAWRKKPFCLTTSEEKPPELGSQPPTPHPTELKDHATGLTLPRKKRFSKGDLVCLGVGVRAKSIAVVKVNVYTVGLYVDPKGARGPLKKFAGSDPSKLSKDASLFTALGKAGFTKYLHLVFARSVGAQQVVDALTSVKGVSEEALSRCARRARAGCSEGLVWLRGERVLTCRIG